MNQGKNRKHPSSLKGGLCPVTEGPAVIFSTHGEVVLVGSEEGETFSVTVLTAADGLILLKQIPHPPAGEPEDR